MSGEQLPLRFRVNAKPVTIRYPTHNSLRLATTGEPMPPATKECELQAAARRCGLKLVWDRYSSKATGPNQYFLRPIWDASRAVRVLPDGGSELVMISAHGRRRSASLLPLDEVETLLSRWSGPKSCAPARFPWQAGVAATPSW